MWKNSSWAPICTAKVCANAKKKHKHTPHEQPTKNTIATTKRSIKTIWPHAVTHLLCLCMLYYLDRINDGTHKTNAIWHSLCARIGKEKELLRTAGPIWMLLSVRRTVCLLRCDANAQNIQIVCIIHLADFNGKLFDIDLVGVFLLEYSFLSAPLPMPKEKSNIILKKINE